MIDGGSGTGTLVAMNVDDRKFYLVVTAAHVIYDPSTQKPMTQATFTPAYCPGSAPGTAPKAPAAPYGTYPIGQPEMFIAKEYRSDGPYRYDYAALLLDQRLDEELLLAPPSLGPCNPAIAGVEIFGYPGISEGNMAGNTGVMLSNNNGLLLHTVSTGTGSSGAPMMQTERSEVVVGVHVSGSRNLDLNWGPEMSLDVIEEIEDWIRDHNRNRQAAS